MPTSKKSMEEVGQEEEAEVAMVVVGVDMAVVGDMAEEETMMMVDMAAAVVVVVDMEVEVVET